MGGKPVTSRNDAPPPNFRAYSPQTTDNDRPQPDIPMRFEGAWRMHVAVRRACRSPCRAVPRRSISGRRQATPATPIRVPSGSVKCPTTRPFGVAGPMTRVHELLGAMQRRLDIRYAHVEDGVARIPRSASDATADSGSVFGGDQVQKPVVSRFRYFLRHGRGHGEFPAEELAEGLSKPSRIVDMTSKCTTSCGI